ncbi:AraC family transcriptional regulator [Synechococcus sp. CS-1332]|uniref:helix-turn-helix transcriptional regulator n=1 Tax=Synechococcus sp. CS-1332 TaxID=2847972 RepID=UPI002880AB54|nr:AraC family transcriptional regulator [Synechococcus sp. CS-1332]MCT0208036.1 AraC family transcriptional regulator [Synechococcus sp. CS-1332]
MDLQPLEPAASWWFYGNNLHLGTLVAAAWTAKPMRVAFSDRRERIALLGCGGEQRLRQASRTWRCSNGCCLLMAKDACTMETSFSSAVAFALSDEHLLQAALSMGGYHQQPEGWQDILDQAHGWSPPADPAKPSLLAALRQTMDMAGQLSGYGRGLLDSLRLDDQIHRLMAAMLLPDLREDKSLDRLRLRQRQGRDAFDELIDYIKQNLGGPLTLTVLESRSHYSRRALQYAFAERMGCGATQWIKNQRLDLARRRLEYPTAKDSVGSIAKECGYRSLGLFSVDFQQRFHVKPSQLLRESRPE